MLPSTHLGDGLHLPRAFARCAVRRDRPAAPRRTEGLQHRRRRPASRSSPAAPWLGRRRCGSSRRRPALGRAARDRLLGRRLVIRRADRLAGDCSFDSVERDLHGVDRASTFDFRQLGSASSSLTDRLRFGRSARRRQRLRARLLLSAWQSLRLRVLRRSSRDRLRPRRSACRRRRSCRRSASVIRTLTVLAEHHAVDRFAERAVGDGHDARCRRLMTSLSTATFSFLSAVCSSM